VITAHLLVAVAIAVPPALPASAPAAAPVTFAKPPLTQEEARRIYTRYQRAKPHHLHRVAAGLALKISERQSRLADVEPPAITIPRAPGRVRWFLTSSTRTQLVFAETRKGWRLVAGASAPIRQQPIHDQDGLAVALDQHTAGLIATPRQVAHTHAISRSTLHSHPQARALLAPGMHTSQAAQSTRSAYGATHGQWALRIRSRALPPIYTLRTRDGGALAWYGMRETQTYTPVSASALPIRFDEPGGVLGPGRSFTRQATITIGSCYLASIPPAATQTKAAVIGAWSTTLAVRGA
jgi:hypothetical protein